MRHLRAVVAMAAAWAAAGPEVTHADRDEEVGRGRGPGPSPTDWADAATVLGVNTHNAFPMPERELDLLQSAGFRWIRTDVMWASIEQQRGVYSIVMTAQRQAEAIRVEGRGVRALATRK